MILSALLFALGCVSRVEVDEATGAGDSQVDRDMEPADLDTEDLNPAEDMFNSVESDATFDDGDDQSIPSDFEDAGEQTDTDPDDDDVELEDCVEGTPCGVVCVDTQTDPNHCGQCGLSCFTVNGEPDCRAGQCEIGACDQGYFDLDDDPANGCESESFCEAGLECETTCGSIGSTMCEGVEAVCQPQAEICNAVDDTCDGSCDGGNLSGCRRPVWRSFGGRKGHAYVDESGFLTERDFNIEGGGNPYFYVYNESYLGMVPLFLCPRGNDRFFLSALTDCGVGRGPVREMGFWATEPLCGSQPLLFYLKPDSNNHFYTLNPTEGQNAVDNLGYLFQGIAGYVWTSP